MAASAHIFTPRDHSLKERIRSLVSVMQAFEEVQVAKKHAKDTKWQDTLGEPEDVFSAYGIIEYSMKRAISAMSHDEIFQAQKEGLLSLDQMKSFLTFQKMHEFQKMSQNSQRGSNTHSPKL